MPKENDLNLKLLPASDIKPASLDLESVRKKLAGAKGPKYWRTLEELTNEQAFGELLEREFPRQASEWVDPVSRRGFLKLAGASLALAGLSGCTKQPPEFIVPYVRQPEELVLGKPLYYATAMPFAGHGLPLLVTSHEYRPTKIEGNAKHGASLGATDLFAQASILDLYDPDRSTTVTHMSEPKPWDEFLGKIGVLIKAQRAIQGVGLRFLTGAVSSPTFGWQMKSILQQFPQAKWHRYDPLHRDSARTGSKMAFGAYYDAIYDFNSADVVVSLDADFLSGSWFPGFVRYSRDFMGRRKLINGKEMNRLYVAESSPSTTGAKADHRLVLRPSEVEKVARALAAKVGVGGATTGQLIPEQQRFVEAVAADLMKSRGKSVIVPGEFSAPAVHVLAHAMNAALGNAGQTVKYIEPVEVEAVEHTESIGGLVNDLNADRVELLVIMGVNPAYDAPADLNFKDALRKAAANPKNKIVQLSQYQNETTDVCHWHIPEAHYLESWSDVRAYDGTASIIQPLILPLYDGKNAHELLAAFEDLPGATSYDRVQAYWQTQHTGDDFELWWRRQVHDGWVADSSFPVRQVSAKPVTLPPLADSSDEIEVVFRPDPTIYDGRFINNGWLQETPKPLTRVTWDNVAMISPAMAERMKLNQLKDDNDHQSDAQNVLEIEFQGRTVKAPYWPQPGHPDNTVTLFLGYGQEKSGRVGKGAGYNAYSVRPSSAQYFGRGAKIERKKEYWSVAVTQGHFSMENRDPVKSVTLAEYRERPQFAHEGEIEPKRDVNGDETLYPDYRNTKEFYQDYAWGMAIDLNSCIGCQACAVACQAENNISIVGKEQVQRGREMQWIRIDAYYEGDVANPNVYFQPVPCMQCENAPCEPVCPVGATVHSTEGLNDMVYNRCVGTRYCSNNCPYKVRRFNFLLYADFETPSLKMLRNPDVSVRSRGVMEKCTYCVQRINAARIQTEIASEKEGEVVRIGDGDIKTACEQVCPTGAIVFGNINDPNSRVSRLKADSRNYSLLAELNTRPRTTYIGAVRNPNPKLESGEKA
jgi:MoCo/4Fe-4S cofactor protein with predicted Tat translocation signal